jgi:D-alanyl-D-alanine carboxypeptidase
MRRRKLKPGAAVFLAAAMVCAASCVAYLVYFYSTRQPASSGSAAASSAVSPSSSAPSSSAASRLSAEDSALLLLVNKDNSLPAGYTPVLAAIAQKYFIQTGVEFSMDSRAAPSMVSMLDAARKDGVDIGIICGYRSNATQTSLYKNKIQRLIDSGVASAAAPSQAALAVAPPGYSEHETGLCADLAYNGKSYLDDSYEKTPAFTWLSAHAAEYGFILRYPKDKTEVTGYEYEPWHYRYVGTANAAAIKARGMCLEEYVKLVGASSSSAAASSAKASSAAASSKTSSK